MLRRQPPYIELANGELLQSYVEDFEMLFKRPSASRNTLTLV